MGFRIWNLENLETVKTFFVLNLLNEDDIEFCEVIEENRSYVLTAELEGESYIQSVFFIDKSTICLGINHTDSVNDYFSNIVVFDYTTNKLEVIRKMEDFLTDLKLTLDPNLLIYSSINTLHSEQNIISKCSISGINLLSGRRVFELNNNSVPKSINITLDSKKLISGSRDGSIRTWNLEKAIKVNTEEEQDYYLVSKIFFTPDGTHVIWEKGGDSCYENYYIYNLKKRQVCLNECCTELNVTLSGKKVVMLDYPGIIYGVYDLEKEETKLFNNIKRDKNEIPIVKDTYFLELKNKIIFLENGKIRTHEIDTGSRIDFINQGENKVFQLTVSPDGEKLIGCLESAEIVVWDISTGQVIGGFLGYTLIPPKEYSIPSFNAFLDNSYKKSSLNEEDAKFLVNVRASVKSLSPNSSFAVLSYLEGSLRCKISKEKIIWSLLNGKKLFEVEGKFWLITPDSKVAIFGSPRDKIKIFQPEESRELTVWDVEKKKKLYDISGYEVPVAFVKATLDSQYLIIGTKDNTIRVFEVESGKNILILRNHMTSSRYVAVAPNSRYCVSIYDRLSIVYWNLLTGEPLSTFTVESKLTCCDISPDGKTIVAGDESGKIHFLQIDD